MVIKVILLGLLVLSNVFAGELIDQNLRFRALYSLDQEEVLSEDILYELSMENAANEADNPSDWFSGKGFESKFAEKVSLSFDNGGITFETRRSAIAVWGKKQNVAGANRVRIVWGVTKYPYGANYEKRKAHAAINLNVAFGTKTYSSGSPFVPAAPYFFSLFPGKSEPLGKFYVHKYWSKTSRHVCVSSGADTKEIITTEFDLKKNFKMVWGGDMPDVSGFLIAINSNKKSGAFIQKIQFLK